MPAAGVIVELGAVTVGVVALGAVSLARRNRRVAGRPHRPADPFAEPVVQRLPCDRRRSARAGDRRSAARAPVVRPVVVRRAHGPVEQRTFALDVGLGGVLVAGPADLAPGELLDLVLDLGDAIRARARVVRESADGMKGLAFEALGEDERATIERYVAAATAVAAR